jgi:RNA polymerase sigma factor (sigma-70 family)
LEGPDEVWMERFLQGDARAFDVLFGRHAPSVRRFVARMAGPEAADDLTQATFLSLVRARDRFRRGSAFKPWLFAIAANAARDHLRRRRPEQLTDEGELPQVEAEPPPSTDQGLERKVREAIDQLPAAQREAILLHRFEGLSFAEVAQAVGASESAVKVRAHRGYQRLRELLSGVKEEA